MKTKLEMIVTLANTFAKSHSAAGDDRTSVEFGLIVTLVQGILKEYNFSAKDGESDDASSSSDSDSDDYEASESSEPNEDVESDLSKSLREWRTKVDSHIARVELHNAQILARVANIESKCAPIFEQFWLFKAETEKRLRGQLDVLTDVRKTMPESLRRAHDILSQQFAEHKAFHAQHISSNERMLNGIVERAQKNIDKRIDELANRIDELQNPSVIAKTALEALKAQRDE